MKKFLLVFSLMFLFVGCTSNSSNETFGYSTLENQNHIIQELSIADIKEKRENQETYFLMVGRPSCSHCVDTILDYSNIAKENNLEVVYYFSFEEIYQQLATDGELNDENEATLDYLEDYLKFDGSTPIFYYIKDGEIEKSSNDVVGTDLQTWADVLRKLFEQSN